MKQQIENTATFTIIEDLVGFIKWLNNNDLSNFIESSGLRLLRQPNLMINKMGVQWLTNNKTVHILAFTVPSNSSKQDNCDGDSIFGKFYRSSLCGHPVVASNEADQYIWINNGMHFEPSFSKSVADILGRL